MAIARLASPRCDSERHRYHQKRQPVLQIKGLRTPAKDTGSLAGTLDHSGVPQSCSATRLGAHAPHIHTTHTCPQLPLLALSIFVIPAGRQPRPSPQCAESYLWRCSETSGLQDIADRIMNHLCAPLPFQKALVEVPSVLKGLLTLLLTD
ncbi:hypothetical protein E2C01_071952 [Portunus trituberculatus]|uniref:Uncharacterized protein n=1 Tax=Portunus trituberculatus TaxID=210409 RepID=A0A5B7I6G7_PORTR|nr:hypothetical protein [Portunus trituberculatus]